MFKLLLISKYLRRKLAPLFAALAVTLCTAMVIIVISVMGGFLDMLRVSIQNLSPQVKVKTWTMNGIAHYDELCSRLEALPEVEAATPVMEALALMQFGGARNDVMALGVRPKDLDRIVDFRDCLFWRTPMFIDDAQERIDDPESSQSMRSFYEDLKARWAEVDLVESGMAMEPRTIWPLSEDVEGLPGAITGIAALPVSRRDERGQYPVEGNAIGSDFTLTVVPLSEQGVLQDPVLRRFVIANEFKSGHYEFDSSLVFVPFDVLQKMLRMEAYESLAIDPTTGEETGAAEQVPGRASEVFVAGADGTPLGDLRAAVDAELGRFLRDTGQDFPLSTITWEEDNAVILGAVQNEKGLVTFLFVIISVVAIVMVATTFYMIVLEKTRDIGVLRAIGASRTGIAGVFLGYGLVIGIVGSGAGFALAWAIVTYLNEIQHLLNAWFGWQMWDPRIYAFDRIPARIDYLNEALPIALGAIASSVIGALIPALLAARLDPVEALRHE